MDMTDLCATVMTYNKLPTASAYTAELNNSFFQVMEAHGRSVLLSPAEEDIIVTHFLL